MSWPGKNQPPPVFCCQYIQRSRSLIDGGMMFVWPSSEAADMTVDADA